MRDIGGAGPVAARLNLFTGLAAASGSTLCEDGRGESLTVSAAGAHAGIPAAGTVTVSVAPRPASLPGPGSPELSVTSGASGSSGSLLEPAQPVHARYWLHGKGPAPAGNMPVAVHLSPAEVRVDDGAAGELRLTVACGPAAADGSVTLTAPAGITLLPAGPLSYQLPPFGYQEWTVAVTAAAGCPPGRRFATAQITDPAGQLVEDSVLLSIGAPPAAQLDLPLAEVAKMQEAIDAALAGEVALSLAAEAIALAPGESGAIELRVRNQAASGIHGEAQLISPFGSWLQTRPWTTGFAVGPDAASTVRFEVDIPPAARPGEHWWAIVKVMYFGRIRYSRAVEVRVIPPPGG